MPLWGNKDQDADKPKYLNVSDKTDTIFVDTDEIGSEATRALGIRSAGWVLRKSKIDSDGNERFFSETLVAMSRTAAEAGDTDDGVTKEEIKITTQPSPVVVAALGDPASFTVAVDDVAATFQWQVREVSGGYSDITAADTEYADYDTDTLTIADTTGLYGYRFRCVASNATTKASVTSASVLLSLA